MTKSKTWEEEFDEAFGDLHEVRIGVPHENHDYPEAPSVKTDSPLINPTNKFVRYIGHDVEEEIKRFIASQIEKTRRETIKECDDKVMTIESKILTDGFRAGLQRAIELVPQEKKYLFHWMKFGDRDDEGFSEGLVDSSDDAPEIADGHSAEFVWNECRKFMLENLKNELNK